MVLPLVTSYVPGPIDGGKHYRSCCQRCHCWSFCTWSCCCKGCEVAHTNKVVISTEMSWTWMLIATGLWFLSIVLTVPYMNSDSMNAYWWILAIIFPCLERLCFGITLHYGKSKGVLVVDNMGNTKSLSKEEVIYYNKVLQENIILKV